MQSVAEFMKQRSRVVEGKERGLALARPGEIRHVDDERSDVARELFLLAQAVHPGSALLRWAREIVAEEEPAMASPRVAHFPHSHVVMPDRHVAAALEGETEQRVGGKEGGLDHLVERKVRLDARLIHVVARLAQLLAAWDWRHYAEKLRKARYDV